MRRRFFAVAVAALGAAAVVAGCRGETTKKATATCTVVERTVREEGGRLEVALAVSWSVNGKNYRQNKPAAVGRFDPGEQSKAALEERFRPGAAVPCSVDPARPTRVDIDAAGAQ
jgi:hypothetical protein